jgi:hypothetical protein
VPDACLYVNMRRSDRVWRIDLCHLCEWQQDYLKEFYDVGLGRQAGEGAVLYFRGLEGQRKMQTLVEKFDEMMLEADSG